MAETPSKSMERLLQQRVLSSMPYSNCNTQIVDLKPLNIPDQATDDEYRAIYKRYIKNASSRDSNASYLCDAIESIKVGIAPPVAFPTETVYGLGADATNEPAVAGIFAAKGRPSDNPLIIHVSSTEHLERVIDAPVPEVYKPVVEKFWPGPLTILLPVSDKGSKFAKNVYPGQQTIGFRMPSSKYARFFIAACDRPIAGPSANSSGKPSPTTAHHVLDDLKGKINFILDGGACEVGVESTVVDGLHDPPLILRPGGVSRDELRALGGRWADTGIGYDTHDNSASSTPGPDEHEHSKQNGFITDTNGAPRAPGMKYKHYSPQAQLILFTPEAQSNGLVQQVLDSLTSSNGKAGPLRVGFIDRTWGELAGLSMKRDITPISSLTAQYSHLQSLRHFKHKLSCTQTSNCTAFGVSVGDTSIDGTITQLATDLFGMLRLFDDLDCDYIFAETVEASAESGKGEGDDQSVVDAVRDRLSKAATRVVRQ